MKTPDTGPDKARRALGIPLALYRPKPRQRRPQPADRAQLILLSNDAAIDVRQPFWIVGDAVDGPDEPERPWHGTRDALWAGQPPDDDATRVPQPALGALAGHDARRDGAAPVVPLAISWDGGSARDTAGVIWFSDGSTLPLQSYLALLHHAGARAPGEAPAGALTWTPARHWLQAELDGRRIAALVRLRRAQARDAQARDALQIATSGCQCEDEEDDAEIRQR